jgi:hypothetical protein
VRIIVWAFVVVYVGIVLVWLWLQWTAWRGITMRVDHPDWFPIGRPVGRGWYVARVEGHDVTVRRGRPFRGGRS